MSEAKPDQSAFQKFEHAVASYALQGVTDAACAAADVEAAGVPIC